MAPGGSLRPVGQVRSNAWKSVPGRDPIFWESHMTRGCPSPAPRVERCQAIAQRNARELAEHLGYFDFGDPWPRFNGVSYNAENCSGWIHAYFVLGAVVWDIQFKGL